MLGRSSHAVLALTPVHDLDPAVPRGPHRSGDRPGDAGYDESRTVFYGGFDRRPAVIARVADASDVSHVVSVARETGLELAVRSGGHSLAAFYERLGWVVWKGPTFVRTNSGLVRTAEEDGNVLARLTPKSPELDLWAPISCDWRPGDVW